MNLIDDQLVELHDAIEAALAEAHVLLVLTMHRLKANLEVGVVAHDAEVKAWMERANELTDEARTLAVRYDELLPNNEIVARFGRDWHDQYKARHPITHETKLVEVAPRPAGFPERYLIPQYIITYSLADALPDFDSPLLRTPVREAQFEIFFVTNGDRLCAAFAPAINTLFWYIETHRKETK